MCYNKHVKGVDDMPEITRFYGIVVKIFFRDKHNPPHIHAVYGEHNGVFRIDTLEMTEGDLPSRAVKMIQEWGLNHKDELQYMWDNRIVKKLPPLK